MDPREAKDLAASETWRFLFFSCFYLALLFRAQVPVIHNRTVHRFNFPVEFLSHHSDVNSQKKVKYWLCTCVVGVVAK